MCLVRRRTDGCSQLCSQRRRKGTLQVSVQSLAVENTPASQRERAAVGNCFEQLVKRKLTKGNSPS